MSKKAKYPRRIDWVEGQRFVLLERDQAAFDTLRADLHVVFEKIGPEAVAKMNRLLDEFVGLKRNKENDND